MKLSQNMREPVAKWKLLIAFGALAASYVVGLALINDLAGSNRVLIRKSSEAQYALCVQSAETVAINNRDRATLLASGVSSKEAVKAASALVKTINEPDARKVGQLIVILLQGAADSAHSEALIRPRRTAVPCAELPGAPNATEP